MLDSNKYRQSIADSLKNRIVKKQNFQKLKKFPIVFGKQAMYIMDWKTSRLEYVQGVFEMLGYSKAEFTMELALNCIHPEDLAIVKLIHRGVINLAINIDLIDQRQYLNITFRLLKKDGLYLKVMRQSSPYQIDESGRFISNLTVLTDISFINSNSNLVEWELFSDHIDLIKFKQNIYKEFTSFFTPREMEIVQLIKDDYTNKRIAVTLFISHHTVVTHRKNILKKSNCHNSKELLTFCALNGITQ